MNVQRMSVVNPEFVKIIDGVLGAEGPVFDNRGNFFMVAPEVEKDGKAAGQIIRVDLFSSQPERTELVCAPSVNGEGGIPAGCQADKEGNLYVADMRLGILHVKPNGEFTQLATADEGGRTMQGCNDCIMDYSGNLWVTAPAGDIAPSPYRRSFEEAFGSIYCLTSDKRIVHLDTGIRFPNGIAVIHNSDSQPIRLIVAETPTRLLWSYDIKGAGVVTNKSVWGKLPDCGCESGPDGMDFDENGNLLVAHWGSGFIEVFGSEGGEPIQRIKCPFDKPSNLHFEPGTSNVYITEHTNHALWKFLWESQGKPQFCEK
uniref:SMP-30/Gluconolactonase/LRE-like region domain-containing protein n=1 Tax=Arion vulgaris TaxID=1028688 RepID=A0A0B6ZM12_9EUPU